MQIEILSAQVGQKWIAFREGADLSDLEEGRIVKWVFDSRECTTGTLIQAASKITVPQSSPAFTLAYNVAFAEIHALSVSGPIASEKPDKAFFEAFPTPVLTSYVMRADTSRGMTDDDLEELKKKPAKEAVT